jgi:hypothetical protein
VFWGDLSLPTGAIPTPFTNSINSDPQLVDPAAANFNLQPSSPAIDKGMNSGIARGINGVPRPQGSAYEIGAYEFTGTQSNNQGHLVTTPSAVDFGTITVGATTTQSITLSNDGNASLTITEATVTGAGFSASGIVLPVTLSPGQSTTLSITFAPQSSGTASGSVALTSNASNPSTAVQLQGSGAAIAGTLAASPTSLSFGNVNVGSSVSKTVTLTASTASVTISQANVTGAGYSVSGLTLPMTLAAGQSATFQVKFAPTAAGTVSGSVSVASNASNTPTTLALSGTGTTATQTCPCSIWSASATPAEAAASDAQAVELGVKFKSDVNGYIAGIRFYKGTTNTGTHTGSLWSSTGTRLATATFSGETSSGWQQVTFATPVAITAGTTYVASYYAPAGHYANNQNYLTAGFDNAPLHALANGGVFAYGASSFPNQTWNASNYWVDVVFTTTAPAPGALAANPTSLSFGNVGVGSSNTMSVSVTASLGSVTISQANVTGAGFSVSGLTLPMTLSAGQSATFQVKFAPTATGSVSGSVSLVSNASNSPATITTTGAGVTATAHSVTLNWTASTSTGVVGYNVYRATQSGGPYTKVNSASVTGTSFVDTNVVAGTTYYYVATAVNSSGMESANSSQASATVPTP